MRVSLRKRVSNWLPDTVFVRLLFFKVFRRFPVLKNPTRWPDKIQWIKLNGNLERFAQYADKYTVRSYVEQKIGSQYLIPLLGVWNNVEDIPFDELPQQFVLKASHGSGYNYICKDKSTLDIPYVKAVVAYWQRENFYKLEREPQYKNCVPRIICEAYLEDDKTNDLTDYKFICCKGVPQVIQVDTDRFIDHKSDLLDVDWNPVEYVHLTTFGKANEKPKKPNNLAEMLRVARKLSADFPFVRVDLYSLKNRVYFGELTFTPGSGLVGFQPISGEVELGKLIPLEAYSSVR